MTRSADGPRVVLASGHMVDSPDRAQPRFPPDQEERVTREVRAVFDRWGVGPGTTLVCGGARGADIIAAEAARNRGGHVRLCLALPLETFEQRSVHLPDSDWTARFRALLEVAEVTVLPEGDRSDIDGEDVFARTNAWMVDVARSLSPDPPSALLVWNGQGGDGPGGTLGLVERLGRPAPGSPHLALIDPTRRAYERRQLPTGQKKLLALDGGGVRGALSLEILKAIEAQLRHSYGQDLVLSDYFDYFGGTSTGAIIASGLAMGKPVAALQEAYRSLAHLVFRKRFLPRRLRSIYGDRPLIDQLNALLGGDTTLGDPQLRSLLLVVLHNTGTDSPWLLSSCTQAPFNRVERCLNRPSDRNLDLPLVPIVRGSTAAPMFFPPQEITVGQSPFVFQDGGITPFNNPALLLFLMATLPQYGLSWPVGDDRLLVVSVGTGSSAAVHPGVAAARINFLFNARNLPSVFMNGASVSQDLLCRALGRCVAGPEIDQEVGTLVGQAGIGERDLFTYVRYDADLSTNALEAEGFSDPRQQRRLRKLDAVDSVDQLRQLGQRTAQGVDVSEHFRGFLPP